MRERQVTLPQVMRLLCLFEVNDFLDILDQSLLLALCDDGDGGIEDVLHGTVKSLKAEKFGITGKLTLSKAKTLTHEQLIELIDLHLVALMG